MQKPKEEKKTKINISVGGNRMKAAQEYKQIVRERGKPKPEAPVPAENQAPVPSLLNIKTEE